MDNPLWRRPTSASSLGSIPWITLAALTITALGGGMVLGAAWAPRRATLAPRRPRRARTPPLPRDPMDDASDEDGVRTGEYHVAPTSGWVPTSTEPPLEAEYLVADAPGSSNHDRRHARRSDDESLAFRLDGAV